MIRVAIAGCGTIANIMHLPGLATLVEQGKVALVAACDPVEAAVRTTAERFAIPATFTDLDRLLAAVDFDLLVNATRIPDHYAVSLAALQAGRHVYTQKPMSTSVAEATNLIEEARRRGLHLASAPEHPVRQVVQTVRRLIAEGQIGRVTFAIVRSSHDGPEKHNVPRDSTWFYQPGSSPLLDIGVHGLSQITAILGPVKRLTGLAGRTAAMRAHTAGPYTGKPIQVNIDDSTLLLLDFGDATFSFLDATYGVMSSRGPVAEIYGSEGTLSLSRQGGELRLECYRLASDEWSAVELPAESSNRCLGTAHLVESLLTGSEMILTGERGRHLVEIMAVAPEAIAAGQTVELATTF